MVKFFIPGTLDYEAAEVLGAIREHLGANEVRPIFRITWEHDGETYTAEVGQPEPLSRSEPVVAILEGPQVYFVCTSSHGALRGKPILAGQPATSSVEYFDD